MMGKNLQRVHPRNNFLTPVSFFFCLLSLLLLLLLLFTLLPSFLVLGSEGIFVAKKISKLEQNGCLGKNYLPSNHEAKIRTNQGCHHSSVDLSAPTILLPRVRVPSTQSTLFHLLYLYYICHVKITKINKNRPGLVHFFKENKNKFPASLS